MPVNKHPGFTITVDLDQEKQNIKSNPRRKEIPKRSQDNLLIASWNLCNLGAKGQRRDPEDLVLMAEIMKPFDLIAAQEIRDDYGEFETVVKKMGSKYDFLMTDRAGNDERLAFIYKTTRVQRTQLAGELVVPTTLPLQMIKKQRKRTYEIEVGQFDRNPYMCSFAAGDFTLTLVNVHIYYGAKSGKKFMRRMAEVYGLAKWAHDRRTESRDKTFDHDLILIGDFNIPKLADNDFVSTQLRAFGMQPTNHSSFQGSNLDGREQFDQIAFHPGETKDRFTGKSGVYDYDGTLFRQKIWDDPAYSEAQFHAYLRHHISDHRPIWSEWHCQR